MKPHHQPPESTPSAQARRGRPLRNLIATIAWFATATVQAQELPAPRPAPAPPIIEPLTPIDPFGDGTFIGEASDKDLIARVEVEVRKALRIPSTDPGLSVKAQPTGPTDGERGGVWCYRSNDGIQIWADWYWFPPIDSPSSLMVFASRGFAENRLYVLDPMLGGQTVSWTEGRPANFWTSMSKERLAEPARAIESIRTSLGTLPNFRIGSEPGDDPSITVSADLSTDPGLPGLEKVIEVQRTLLRIASENRAPERPSVDAESQSTVADAGSTGAPQDRQPPSPEPLVPAFEIAPTPGEPERPVVRPEPVSDSKTEITQGTGVEVTRPPVDSEPPIQRPDSGIDAGTRPTTPPTPDGGLEGLSLKLDYPKLEIAEDRAIPLFFTVLGNYTGTNDVTVRTRFVSGTATPGKDFDMDKPFIRLPAQGGLGSMAWLPLPPIYDEVDEGKETAVFELSIDGSTNAPVLMEVTILDDMTPGNVGFVSQRFQINEGSTNGYAQIRLWRTLDTRRTTTVAFRLDGPAAALAVLGGQTRRTATFGPGDSQIFVQIPLVNNTDAQGTQDITLTLEKPEGEIGLLEGFESTVLTLADDETPAAAAPLSISEFESGDGQRGVMLTTTVPRGYQVRLEFSDNGAAGPWQPYWLFEGNDVERTTFDSFATSVMRMYRILPPEPLDFTFPW